MSARLATFLLLSALPAMSLAAGPAWAQSPSPAPSVAPSPVPETFFGLPRGNRAIAVTLSTVVSGLGQHYNGEPEKGNLMLASLLTFPVAYGLDTLTDGAVLRVFSFVILVGVKGWSVIDAYQHAVPAPAPTPKPSARPAPARP